MFVQVERIVIFERGQVVHALVEYSETAAALLAKQNLHGCNIYTNCCTLKVKVTQTVGLTNWRIVC